MVSWLRRLRWTAALSGVVPPQRRSQNLPPGLLLLQIDGLSRVELEASLAAGRMPFLKSLLDDGSHRLHSMFSGLPATTPAFQGEFFYGVSQSVPAWSFREDATGGIAQFLDAEVVARREESLQAMGEALLLGGSAYACLFRGGAAEVHFCTGEERWLNFYTHLPLRVRLALAVRYLARAPRVVVEMLLEATRGIVQALASGEQMLDQLRFIPKRAAVNVAVRRYMQASIGADVVRGLPIIYANFLDYDSHAHIAGPHSRFARQVLSGLDRTLHTLWNRAQASGQRNYEVWFFSDHGQETSRPYSPDGEGALARLLKPRLRDGESLLSADNGPVAHLYWTPPLDAERREDTARHLVHVLGVPQVVAAAGPEDAWVWNADGKFLLSRDWRRCVVAERCAEDLIRLARHPESGELIALGWKPGQSLSFARENGCHAGPGPEETEAFLLVPSDVPVEAENIRPIQLRELVRKRLDR